MVSVNDAALNVGVGALSVTVTVIGNVPELVGVPDRKPSVPSVRPVGSTPAVSFQLSGRNPPVAVKRYPYSTPVAPLGGTDAGSMTDTPGLVIATVKDCVTDCGLCALSAATTEKVDERAVGDTVPVSVPSGPSTSPSGNAPVLRLHVNGGEPPAAVNVKFG
jgi:hypothetical protein